MGTELWISGLIWAGLLFFSALSALLFHSGKNWIIPKKQLAFRVMPAIIMVFLLLIAFMSPEIFTRHLLKERILLVLCAMLGLIVLCSITWFVFGCIQGFWAVKIKRIIGLYLLIFTALSSCLLGEFALPLHHSLEPVFVEKVDAAPTEIPSLPAWYVVNEEIPSFIKDPNLRSYLSSCDAIKEEDTALLVVYGKQIDDITIQVWDYDKKREEHGSFRAKIQYLEEPATNAYFVYLIPDVAIH